MFYHIITVTLLLLSLSQPSKADHFSLKLSTWSVPDCFGTVNDVSVFENVTREYERCDVLGKDDATASYVQYSCDGMRFYESKADCDASRNEITPQSFNIDSGTSIIVKTEDSCFSIALITPNQAPSGLS